MKTEEIALSRVSENEANPRTITEANFQKLVKSILVFPKMLQLRPIVVDETYKALGGNMRTRALCHIVSMTPEAIMDVLDTDQRLTDAESWQSPTTGASGRSSRQRPSSRHQTSRNRRRKNSSSKIMQASETGTPKHWQTSSETSR